MELALPTDLQKAIEDAYATLTKHPQHALLPIYRARVYAALGAVHYPEEPLDPHAHRTRVTLDLLTVQRVLPIWQAQRPDFPWPQRLLEMAEGVLNGSVSMEAARAEADAVWALLEEGEDTYKGEVEEEAEEDSNGVSEEEAASEIAKFKGVSASALLVCDAAVETLFVASGLFQFDSPDFTEEMTDADVDPWSSDTAKWASTAYAGAVWDPSSDPVMRKEFWEWWLTEAVPRAWQASQYCLRHNYARS
jgi:hypothetical protein